MSSAGQLTEWVKIKHDGQLIRRVGEPYFNHLIAVATMAKDAVFGYEIGLCHDLLEDTATSSAELRDNLIKFGYSEKDSSFITSSVVELTDVFTTTAYPGLSKKKRKKLEAARLMTIGPVAQTVKYADLIYNMEWVWKYDQKHLKKYVKKKRKLLIGLNKGDPMLHKEALNLIR